MIRPMAISARKASPATVAVRRWAGCAGRARQVRTTSQAINSTVTAARARRTTCGQPAVVVGYQPPEGPAHAARQRAGAGDQDTAHVQRVGRGYRDQAEPRQAATRRKAVGQRRIGMARERHHGRGQHERRGDQRRTQVEHSDGAIEPGQHGERRRRRSPQRGTGSRRAAVGSASGSCASDAN